jgi:hypothetical protein
MGKRELVIVLVFAALGTAAYQWSVPRSPDASGPEAAPGGIGRLLGDDRHQFAVERRATTPVPPGVVRLDVSRLRGSVVVEGGEGDAVDATLNVAVRGRNEAQARTRGERVSLALDVDDGRVRPRVRLPESLSAEAVELRLRVPRRLTVAVAATEGVVSIERVAGVELDARRARVRVSEVAGRVEGEVRDARATFESIDTVDLELDRVTADLRRISRGLTIDQRGGVLTLEDIEARTELDIERATLICAGVRAPLDIRAARGQTTIRDLAERLTYRGERAPLAVVLTRPVAVDATVDTGAIDLQLPPSGPYTLHAEARRGLIDAPRELTVERDAEGARLATSVPGGGPDITLRTERGRVIIRRTIEGEPTAPSAPTAPTAPRRPGRPPRTL